MMPPAMNHGSSLEVVISHRLITDGLFSREKNIAGSSQMLKTPCICADPGANPQHDPESLFMKMGDHRLRVWKDCRVPFPDAVIFVPEVVDYKNSRRHSRVEDFLGVLEHFFLGGIFAHSDPRVVLRC